MHYQHLMKNLPLKDLRVGLAQQQLTLEPIRLRQQVAPFAGLECHQCLGQQAQSLLTLAHVPCGFAALDETERSRHLMPRGQEGGQTLAQLRQARLAAEQYHLPHAQSGLVPAPLHECHFFVPGD